MQASIRHQAATGLSPDQWHRLKPLLERCRDLPPEEREEVLRGEFADDATLVDRALEMLAAYTPESETETFDGIDAGDHADRLVGKFRLHHIIGRGGCGVVYEASRVEPIQRVAVKILKPGKDQGKIRERFEQEARILSSMHHPNIVRFLDWGDVDGLPYFAMEFVGGKRIDDYCRDKRLTLTARLRLFQDICSGVQYAHNHEIVHRDLKPDNVLVSDEFGQVKLLDFGVAKIMDPQLWGRHPLTRPAGFQPKTSAWASPEQLQDQPVTAASDIYALGLLLLHLLTGKASEDDRARRPSSMVTPEMADEMRERSIARLRKKICGDLDSIVAKALAARREERYQSAARFADDIGDYLNGRTVTAHPDNMRYRMRKFIARHRVMVASIVLAFVALSTGLATARYHQVQAERARERAELKTREVESVNSGITKMVSRFGMVLQRIERDQTEKLAMLYEDIGNDLERARNYRSAQKFWTGAKRMWETLDNRIGVRSAEAQLQRLKDAEARQASTIGIAAARPASLRLTDGVSPELLAEAYLTEALILRSSGLVDDSAKALQRARTLLSAAPASTRRSELMKQLEDY